MAALYGVGEVRVVDQASGEIVIEAPASSVIAVIADFPNYPAWASFIRRVQVLDPGVGGRAHRVRLGMDAGPIRDDYVLDYDWDGDRGVSWHLVSSTLQRAQEGAYELAADGARTRVTYRLQVETVLPMPGLLRRRAERMIIDTALTELKRHVESLAGRPAGHPDRSP